MDQGRPVDLIGTSDDWGAGKPDIAFFERVAAAVPFAPQEILYVGDRVDNDLRRARRPGCGPRWSAGDRGQRSSGSRKRPGRSRSAYDVASKLGYNDLAAIALARMDWARPGARKTTSPPNALGMVWSAVSR